MFLLSLKKDEVFSAAFVRCSKRIRSVQRRDREVIKGAPLASEDLMCINKRTRINNANKTEIAFIEFVLSI